MTKRDSVTLLESIADGVIEPAGMVHVKIKNERGKSVHEESKPNFISKVWKAHARALLRVNWSHFGYNIQMTGQESANVADAMFPYNSRGTIPALPIMALGCWNDTSAEDSVNEDQIYLPANDTGMVAWATRWPFGSSTAGRGNVDLTDSFVDDDTVRQVFNWSATQGNGTFQSVGWFNPGGPSMPATYWGVAHRGMGLSTQTPGSIIGSATALYHGGGWVDPSTGLFYQALRRQATSGAMRLVSWDLSTMLDDSSVSILGSQAIQTGMTLTNQSDEFTPTSSQITTSSGIAVIGIDASSNRIFTYATGSGTHRWGRILSSGAVTSYTSPAGGNGWLCGAVISTHAYLGSGNDGNIYKCLTSDGSTVSTIAIDANVTAICTLLGITTPRPVLMTTDGTDLFVIYGHSASSSLGQWVLVRLDNTGVLQQIYGTVPHHHQTPTGNSETSTSPYAGTMFYNRGNWFNYGTYYPFSTDGSSGGQTTEDFLSASLSSQATDSNMWTPGVTDAERYVNLCYYDGTLFLIDAGGTATTSQRVRVFRLGYNLGSRVKLASPAVKANPNTMEITYDITLPGWF